MPVFTGIMPYFKPQKDSVYQSLPDGGGSFRDSSDGSLRSDEALLSEKEIADLRGKKRSFFRRWWTAILVHALILCFYIGGLVAVYHAGMKEGNIRGPNLVHSPAHEAVFYEETTFVENSQEHGPFSGFPRPEIDQNWHDLINDENIILEPEVMRHYGREELGVAVPEGGGYIGTLNVYHELHCIKRLYQYSYPEYYWDNLDDKQREINRLHNEHCLDFLRQASMCHGDVGLITFQWSPTSLIPVANATTHECVNWKKIDEWTKERTVDMMKPGWLVHPTLGPAYPEGEGDKLGAFKKKPGDNTPHLAEHIHGDHN